MVVRKREAGRNLSHRNALEFIAPLTSTGGGDPATDAGFVLDLGKRAM